MYRSVLQANFKRSPERFAMRRQGINIVDRDLSTMNQHNIYQQTGNTSVQILSAGLQIIVGKLGDMRLNICFSSLFSEQSCRNLLLRDSIRTARISLSLRHSDLDFGLTMAFTELANESQSLVIVIHRCARVRSDCTGIATIESFVFRL